MVGKTKRRREEEGRGRDREERSCQESQRRKEETGTTPAGITFEYSESYKSALKLLLSKTSEPENWQKHSIAVSEVASAIAEALLEKGIGIDFDYISIGSLLHDIGRSIDCGTLHGWEGFKILQSSSFRRYAGPCVTHWLKGRNYEEIHEEGDLPLDLVREIISSGNFEMLPLEDRIICVADAMARGEEIVTIKERYVDARKRYGTNPWVDTNEKLTLQFKDEIDRLLDRDTYLLFPETSD